ncbi:MAG: phosphatidylserine decarboxylase [Lachnospiraceae bacterium]|nr:phosphatidylserine decarboxylase [Lachnospiraceae bacterium]
MKKSVILFLYKTPVGRGVLLALTQSAVSRWVGAFLDSRLSGWLAPLFIRKYGLDMTEYGRIKYRSFNDFFTRKRCEEKVDIALDHLLSPCDGYLSVYPISDERTYQIKHVEYSLDQLLQSRELAERFAGGLCLIFRLTPQDYHRYCYVCSGHVTQAKEIPGRLHCVRPVACASRPVFVENSREFIEIETRRFGAVIQMEVGALLVGKIHNHSHGSQVFQGVEKGYFAFGGSTILVLVQKDRLLINENIWRDRAWGRETRVRLGERAGLWQSKWEEVKG